MLVCSFALTGLRTCWRLNRCCSFVIARVPLIGKKEHGVCWELCNRWGHRLSPESVAALADLYVICIIMYIYIYYSKYEVSPQRQLLHQPSAEDFRLLVVRCFTRLKILLASETIESNQRHGAAPGINIQTFGSVRRISVKDDPGSTSWINGHDVRDVRDEGFFRVSL